MDSKKTKITFPNCPNKPVKSRRANRITARANAPTRANSKTGKNTFVRKESCILLIAGDNRAAISKSSA